MVVGYSNKVERKEKGRRIKTKSTPKSRC